MYRTNKVATRPAPRFFHGSPHFERRVFHLRRRTHLITGTCLETAVVSGTASAEEMATIGEINVKQYIKPYGTTEEPSPSRNRPSLLFRHLHSRSRPPPDNTIPPAICHFPTRSTEGSTAGKGRSYGGYNYHDDDEEDSTLPSPGLHPYDDSPAMNSKRRGGYRQRADYYHDDGGGIGTTITHLDDHAEQLWHNSPAIRAAAAAAAAAAAEAAGDSLDREAGPSPRIGAPLPSRGAAASEREAWEEGPGKEQQHRVPREPFDGSAEREGLFSDGDGLDSDGLAVDDDGVGVDPDLRTHFDLGDLELAAEKALDLLRDSGDVSGGDGGDGATEPETGVDESGPDLRPDLEDLELAAEKALDLLRDDGGGARGQDSAGRQDDGGTSAAAAAAASVTGRSMRVPMRLSVGVDTDSAAAVPAHGGAAPLSADSTQQDANRQQEQKEEEGKSSSSTGVAVVRGKEKTSGGRLTLPSPPSPAPKVPPAAAIGGSVGGGGTPGRHSTSFVAVAARAVSPAVCRIDMERLVGTRHDGSPFTDVETGQGSGLIFSSEDGLVLTNAHVVAGARKVRYSYIVPAVRQLNLVG